MKFNCNINLVVERTTWVNKPCLFNYEQICESYLIQRSSTLYKYTIEILIGNLRAVSQKAKQNMTQQVFVISRCIALKKRYIRRKILWFCLFTKLWYFICISVINIIDINQVVSTWGYQFIGYIISWSEFLMIVLVCNCMLGSLNRVKKQLQNSSVHAKVVVYNDLLNL